MRSGSGRKSRRPRQEAAPKPKPEAKPEAKPKPKKPEILNIEEKIELQGMPFDKAEMTADNKKELDDFLGALRKATKARAAVQFGAVVVTGHTDRIGSLKYNMKLSERRAVVVKDYLVSKGVDQKLIFWEGKGSEAADPGDQVLRQQDEAQAVDRVSVAEPPRDRGNRRPRRVAGEAEAGGQAGSQAGSQAEAKPKP